jgi:hypothetical protein
MARYRIACPKVGDEDIPCEATVTVTLASERVESGLWIEDYDPECAHEWDDLTPGEQDEATDFAIEVATEHAIEMQESRYESRYDTREERDLAKGDF